jgi:hypothetical protein
VLKLPADDVALVQRLDVGQVEEVERDRRLDQIGGRSIT